jgi:hypothetical protein
MPVLKAGKDHSLASSYRPIASLVTCARQWSAWWTVVLPGSWKAETSSPVQRADFDVIDPPGPPGGPRIPHTECRSLASVSTLLLSSSTWRRHMIQPGVMISSEPFTGGISGVDYHRFFLSSRPITSASDLEMCYLRDMLKNIESDKNQY